MNEFINFLTDNYLVFLLISLILIFALIGCIVDGRRKKLGLKPVKKAQKPAKTEVKEDVFAGQKEEVLTVEPTPAEKVLNPEPEKSVEEDLNVPDEVVVKTEVLEQSTPEEQPKEENLNVPDQVVINQDDESGPLKMD